MALYERSRHPEDGGSKDLWNIGILPQHCTASQTRRPRLEICLHIYLKFIKMNHHPRIYIFKRIGHYKYMRFVCVFWEGFEEIDIDQFHLPVEASLC